MRNDRKHNDNHNVIAKQKYTYLFVTGIRVRTRSVRAIDKFNAIVKIRELYPECLKAGCNWICLCEDEITPERLKLECESLRRWAKVYGAMSLDELQEAM